MTEEVSKTAVAAWFDTSDVASLRVTIPASPRAVDLVIPATRAMRGVSGG